MAKQALGIIETVGLAAGVEAADAAVKSAGVRLTGYELTKGGGMVLIKVEGDVGAVKAAIDAAFAAASKVGKVVAKHVIPRPHESLEMLIRNKDTVGLQKEQPESPKPVKSSEPVEVKEEEPAPSDEPEQAMEEEQPPVEEEQVIEQPPVVEEQATEDETSAEEEVPETPAAASDADLCNLCSDPACPRRKGEPRQNCIHNKGGA